MWAGADAAAGRGKKRSKENGASMGGWGEQLWLHYPAGPKHLSSLLPWILLFRRARFRSQSSNHCPHLIYPVTPGDAMLVDRRVQT